MDHIETPHRGVSIVVKAPGGRFRFGLLLVVAVVALVAIVAARGTGYEYGPAPETAAMSLPEVPNDGGTARKLQTKLVAQNKQFATALDKLAPTGTYVVVDQTQNRLYIMNDDKIVRTAVCSAGSGMVLKAAGSSKKWVFDTPRGVFKVRNKISNPIWKKPDWAFAEGLRG